MRPRLRDGAAARPQRRAPHGHVPLHAPHGVHAPVAPVTAAARDRRDTVWLFDLDNTLHDASHAVFRDLSPAMTDYIVRHLGVDPATASSLRTHYWRRYGVTMLGLVRHHGVDAAHFLEETHTLPGLESRLRMYGPDRAALRRLWGRRYIVTNAPRGYALRVLAGLRLAGLFDGLIAIDDMRMFGDHRPKPDARMFRHLAAALKVRPSRCVLVEDTLEHQRSARSVGMRTVWMTGYARQAAREAAGARAVRWPSPGYVCARIVRIQQLRADR